MSYHCSLALVEVFSARGCLDGGQCAELRSIRTAEKSCFDARKKASYRRSLSGMTYAPSTASLGVAAWMSSLADFPALRGAQRGSNEEKPTNETCGQTPFALLEKSDQGSAFWKTSQGFFPFGDQTGDPTLGEYSETWPKAGLMRDGAVYRRRNWERRIAEIGSGLLQTPSAQDSRRGSAAAWKEWSEGGRTTQCRLRNQIHVWPTPNVPNGGRVVPKDAIWKGSTAYCPRTGKKIQVGLEHAARMWPTPQARDCNTYAKCKRGANSPGGTSLTVAAADSMWPAPASRDHRHLHAKSYEERGGGKKGEQLPDAVGGSLNPPWVEWLMGWPIGWTDLKPLEMDKFRLWLEQHGVCLPSRES